MRTGLALFLALVLAATPAMGQGKTKTTAADEAVAALEVCEIFARGDVLALEAATEAGWDAYDQEAESPFIRSYGASREIPLVGWGDLFVLVESYPDATLGYCRMDVVDVSGNGTAAIEAISGLERYAGDVRTENGGSYASLAGSGDEESLLISHWDDAGFVIQLTIITPKTARAEQ